MTKITIKPYTPRKDYEQITIKELIAHLNRVDETAKVELVRSIDEHSFEPIISVKFPLHLVKL